MKSMQPEIHNYYGKLQGLHQPLPSDHQPIHRRQTVISPATAVKAVWAKKRTKSTCRTFLNTNTIGFSTTNPSTADQAPRGIVGIPRVLNMYENYPFWYHFLHKAGIIVWCFPRIPPRKSMNWVLNPFPVNPPAIRPSWFMAILCGCIAAGREIHLLSMYSL